MRVMWWSFCSSELKMIYTMPVLRCRFRAARSVMNTLVIVSLSVCNMFYLKYILRIFSLVPVQIHKFITQVVEVAGQQGGMSCIVKLG